MSTDKPHHRISRTIQAAHKEDRRPAGRESLAVHRHKGSLCGVQVKCLTEDTMEINYLIEIHSDLVHVDGQPGRQRHRTARTHAHDDASDPACLHASASTRLPCGR